MRAEVTPDKLVSVIIPVFNSQQSIIDALSSVKAQTYENFEVLIYDDCSTDNSAAQIMTFIADDERFTLYRGNDNRGAGYARDFLLKRVRGGAIAFLDADDFWYPAKLKVQLDVLDKTEAGVVSCAYQVVDSSGSVIGMRRPPKKIFKSMLLLANWFPTSMTILRSDLVAAREMSHRRMRQDYAYWLKVFQSNESLVATTVPEVLGYYRRQENSLSSRWYRNLWANYQLWRHERGKMWLTALLLVVLNVLVRMVRT